MPSMNKQGTQTVILNWDMWASICSSSHVPTISKGVAIFVAAKPTRQLCGSLKTNKYILSWGFWGLPNMGLLKTKCLCKSFCYHIKIWIHKLLAHWPIGSPLIWKRYKQISSRQVTNLSQEVLHPVWDWDTGHFHHTHSLCCSHFVQNASRVNDHLFYLWS